MNRKERAITFGTINLDLPRNIALRKHLNNNGLLISQYYRTQLYNYSKDSKIIDSFFNVRDVSKISKKETLLQSKKITQTALPTPELLQKNISLMKVQHHTTIESE